MGEIHEAFAIVRRRRGLPPYNQRAGELLVRRDRAERRGRSREYLRRLDAEIAAAYLKPGTMA